MGKDQGDSHIRGLYSSGEMGREGEELKWEGNLEPQIACG